jgi:ribosomal protein L16 Arg81 hydroxylase
MFKGLLDNMQIDPQHFEDLLKPMTSEKFFSEYWEKKPLLLQNRDVQGYQNLLTLKDLENLLFTHVVQPGRATPWVRFVNNKKMLNVDDYVEAKSGLFNRTKVINGFKEGNTLALYRLEDRFEPLKRLCQTWEDLFGHPCATEVFLTPPRSQGFRAHFDQFNIFILQAEGEKLWKIYDIYEPFPLVANDMPYNGELPEPLYEVVVKPGDLLYLPRGYVHETVATDKYSLHVSLAVNIFTWLDLMHEILKSVPEFRKALPIGSLFLEDSDQLDTSCFEQVDDAFKDFTKVEDAFKLIKNRFAKLKKYEAQESLDSALEEPSLTIETILKKREGIFCSLSSTEEEAKLAFAEEEITGPNFIEPALQYIMDTTQFSVKNIPNTLTDSGKITLVKSLIKSGLLVIEN